MSLEELSPKISHRQGWLGLLLLTTVFFMGDRFASVLMDHIVMGSRFRYSLLYSGNAKSDILILGNSRAVNSFYAPEMSRRLHCQCLNLAYNGMSPDVALAILHDYLERHPPPRMVLLEATCVDNDSLCVVNFKPYWRHSSRLRSIASTVAPQSACASTLSQLFDFNCELFFRVLSHRESSDQDWINRYTIDEDLLCKTQQMKPFALPDITAKEAHDLRALRDLTAQYGIELQVVIAPYLPAYRAAITNLDTRAKEFNSILAPLSIVDLSAAVTDTECFADRLHTNLRGSDVILNQLEQLQLFAGLQTGGDSH